MIAKARLLARSASFGELGGFAGMSVIAVFVIGISGSMMTRAFPELAGAKSGLDGAYLVEVSGALWPVLYALVGVFVAFKNFQGFENTVARCELAEDELAWIKDHPEYERMVEDREFMRLAANVSRACRTYPATHGLFERFLEEYRVLLKNYGSGLERTPGGQARMRDLNEAADEGLEQHEIRTKREQRRKNREKS